MTAKIHKLNTKHFLNLKKLHAEKKYESSSKIISVMHVYILGMDESAFRDGIQTL